MQPPRCQKRDSHRRAATKRIAAYSFDEDQSAGDEGIRSRNENQHGIVHAVLTQEWNEATCPVWSWWRSMRMRWIS